MEEKRKDVRWNLILPVRYVGLSRHTESSARTQDISVSGAKLTMVERHKLGDRLELMLDVPIEGREHVCIEAEVMWQKPSCILDEGCNYITGVAFRKILDCHRKGLLDYVAENHPQEFRQHWWDGIK